ncbi:dentin sialophosphoprotein-like, partial [Trifolium medium]|nr:dentin sialophosphoprotein-like [Trifolium medium]
MNTDPMEGTGISVLLKRSSSNKGPIVRARTFTATTISYDDLSLSRDSVNSIRSSTRPGSYSASSSTDFGSTRPTEFRIHRQSSGRKLDADCGYDSRIKPSSTSSSISITSNHSHHEVG